MKLLRWTILLFPLVVIVKANYVEDVAKLVSEAGQMILNEEWTIDDEEYREYVSNGIYGYFNKFVKENPKVNFPSVLHAVCDHVFRQGNGNAAMYIGCAVVLDYGVLHQVWNGDSATLTREFLNVLGTDVLTFRATELPDTKKFLATERGQQFKRYAAKEMQMLVDMCYKMAKHLINKAVHERKQLTEDEHKMEMACRNVVESAKVKPGPPLPRLYSPGLPKY